MKTIKTFLETIHLALSALYLGAVFIFSVLVLGKLAYDLVLEGVKTLKRKFSRKS